MSYNLNISPLLAMQEQRMQIEYDRINQARAARERRKARRRRNRGLAIGAVAAVAVPALAPAALGAVGATGAAASLKAASFGTKAMLGMTAGNLVANLAGGQEGGQAYGQVAGQAMSMIETARTMDTMTRTHKDRVNLGADADKINTPASEWGPRRNYTREAPAAVPQVASTAELYTDDSMRARASRLGLTSESTAIRRPSGPSVKDMRTTPRDGGLFWPSLLYTDDSMRARASRLGLTSESTAIRRPSGPSVKDMRTTPRDDGLFWPLAL
jgi:hypothetical protein